MGGNLYKLPRVTKEKYFRIESEIKPVLDVHFGDRYRIPKAYLSKETYGDLDIIVDAGIVQNKDWITPLQNDLGITEIKRVRNVVSMLYDGLQVDFFLVRTARLDSTYNFMSYNILGNLLGRIFHKFNLKYGEDGLFYVFRSFNNHVSKEVILSRDTKKIFDFLKLDYVRWEKGFDKVEEIYDYVYNSHYFTSSSYLKETPFIKKKSERPEFLGFIDYVSAKEIKNYPFNKDKDSYIPMIDEFFPDAQLLKKHKQHLDKQEKLKQLVIKFNGNIIMSLFPDLKGKELGSFIGDFKSAYNSEDEFEAMVLKLSQEEVNGQIIKHYDKWKKQVSA